MFAFAVSAATQRRLLPVVFLVMLFPVSMAVAQEYVLFETENETADQIFGWDTFAGNYAGPHESLLDEPGSFIEIAPDGGAVTTSGNLYAAFTFPNYTFDINGLGTDEAFSSIVLQFATTEPITIDQFDVLPGEFVELGQRSTLTFGDMELPVFFYWAEWIESPATESFSVTISGMAMHASFAGARVAAFNTAEPLDVTFGGKVLLGDVDGDGEVTLADIAPFVEILSTGEYTAEADINQDNSVDLADIPLFVDVLANR